MSLNDTPRVRSLLRQAERNVEAGKLVAAEELYQQIVAEAPQSASGWLGLAQTTSDPRARQDAYERVLVLDEGNAQALAALSGELPPQEVAGTLTAGQEAGFAASEAAQKAGQTAVPATTTTAPPPDSPRPPAVDLELFCYRHPNRSTSLRCYKCNKPICSECTVKTPVGYLCPDCYREAEDSFFNARPLDYVLAALVAFPLSLLAGWLVARFGSGFIFYILIFFIGSAVGGFIGRITKRVIGGRRGRYIPHLVAGCVILGAVIPALPLLLFVLTGNPGALFGLIGPGIYLATAVSSAFFWAR
jgi:hypothetical protein